VPSPLIVIPALLGVADDTAMWNAENGRKGVPDPFRDGDFPRLISRNAV
jgi:hypothetical protein